MKKKYFILIFLVNLSKSVYPQEAIGLQLINDFYQDEVTEDKILKQCLQDKVWGNCVTIAVIKAALSQFNNVPSIYNKFEERNDSTYITFNDGLEISISEEEMEVADSLNGFGISHNSIYYDSATIVYASICKRALIKKDTYTSGRCIHSFTDAVNFINSGYPTNSCGELLGLKLIRVKKRKLKNSQSCIINTPAHTTYCSYGVQDILGKKHVIKRRWMQNPRGIGWFITGAYVLSKN